AASIQQPGAQYERIALQGMGTPRADEPGLGRLLHAWQLVAEAQEPTAKVRKAMHKGQVDSETVIDALEEAVAGQITSADEADRGREAEPAPLNAIQSDEFTPEQYYRDANGTDHDRRAQPTVARAVNQ